VSNIIRSLKRTALLYVLVSLVLHFLGIIH
jgi:hypothetical protein